MSEGTKYRLVGGNTATGIYDDGPYDAFIDVKQVNELKKCSKGKFFFYDRKTTCFITKFHVREDFLCLFTFIRTRCHRQDWQDQDVVATGAKFFLSNGLLLLLALPD